MKKQRVEQFGPLRNATVALRGYHPDGSVQVVDEFGGVNVTVHDAIKDDAPEQVEVSYLNADVRGGAVLAGFSLRFPDGTSGSFWISAKRSEDGESADVRTWAEPAKSGDNFTFKVDNPNPKWFHQGEVEEA